MLSLHYWVRPLLIITGSFLNCRLCISLIAKFSVLYGRLPQCRWLFLLRRFKLKSWDILLARCGVVSMLIHRWRSMKLILGWLLLKSVRFRRQTRVAHLLLFLLMFVESGSDMWLQKLTILVIMDYQSLIRYFVPEIRVIFRLRILRFWGRLGDSLQSTIKLRVACSFLF